MAQDVVIAGASYPDVPGVNLPKSGGGSALFVDTSDADAAEADILAPKTAYVGGAKITGTGTGGGGGAILGHKFISGSFTLAADQMSEYTIMTGTQLFDGIKEDFPGATSILRNVYVAGGTSDWPLYQFLMGACWMDVVSGDAIANSAHPDRWQAGFVYKPEVNSSSGVAVYANRYNSYQASTLSGDHLGIDYDAVRVKFGVSRIGYAGAKYNYIIWAIDHGGVK